MISIKGSWLIFVVVLLFPRTLPAQAEYDLPEIRSSPTNTVPACVTADNLMSFVRDRNRKLNPPKDIDKRFSSIATLYKSIGECVEKINNECVGVRWDFAFFQMLVETNYLTFTGGVAAEDNNFAGIGATVPGKPGERFQSMQDGILAHLQHVLMYSGTPIENPIAERTRLVQHIVLKSVNALGQAATYSDLTSMWVGGGRDTYATSILNTSAAFRRQFCITE